MRVFVVWTFQDFLIFACIGLVIIVGALWWIVMVYERLRRRITRWWGGR